MNPTESNNQSGSTPENNSELSQTDAQEVSNPLQPSASSINQQENQQFTQMESINAPGVIVLQWLTYAFWGWTILGLTWLTGTVMASLVADVDSGSFTAYALASVLVLLPISLLCDFFYSKKEPTKKTGAATIVMVIHAVIFALFGIGALITAVFSVVTLFTSSSDTSGNLAFLYSALIIFLAYLAIFIRTINPPQFPIARKASIGFILSIIIIISVIGVFGPIAKERSSKEDRLVEGNIDLIVSGISNYSDEQNKLPGSLSDLDLDGDAEKLVNSGLIDYEPEEKTITNDDDDYKNSSYGMGYSETIYYYSLCANYKHDKKSKYNSGYSRSDSDGYSRMIDTSKHDSGKVCYKLKTGY